MFRQLSNTFKIFKKEYQEFKKNRQKLEKKEDNNYIYLILLPMQAYSVVLLAQAAENFHRAKRRLNR